MKSFKAGFSKGFIFGFLKKVGLGYLGWVIVLGIVTYVASILGLFALIVGAFFVSTLMLYAWIHLLFQHYDLYLERGGEGIVVHPEVLKSASDIPPLPQESRSSEEA